MELKAALSNPVRAGFASCLLLLGSGVQAEVIDNSPSVGAMVADAALARPLYFVMSQAGLVLYTVTLPFSALGNNADAAAEAMVVTPLQATFTRCLGCGKANSDIRDQKEGDGKYIDHFLMSSGGLVLTTTDNKKGTGIGGGIHYGTRFVLGDRSRFDVLLGVRSLGVIEYDKPATTYQDTVLSYQAISRVGRAMTEKSGAMLKLGMHMWTADREVSSPAASTTSFGGFGMLLGAAVDYRFNKSFTAGLEYTHYSLSDGAFNSSINSFDGTLAYHF